MEKKTKVIVALAVMAVVIGAVIYFYTKKKKEDAALKMVDSKDKTKPSPSAVKKYVGVKTNLKPKVSFAAMAKPAADFQLAPDA